jgi:hypothetical protein
VAEGSIAWVGDGSALWFTRAEIAAFVGASRVVPSHFNHQDRRAMFKRLSIVLVLVAGTLVLGVTPAMASNTCETIVHTNLDNVHVTADGTADITNRGVKVTLPSAQSKVDTRFVPAEVTKLGEIQKLSYQTRKGDVGPGAAVVLPTYQIEIDINGGELQTGEYTTLVFEPYVVGATPKTWNTWDVETGKFWSTRDIVPGMGAHDTAHAMTIDQIVNALPDATVLRYGVTVGSANTGFIGRFDKVQFKTSHECVTHKWTPATTPTPTPTVADPSPTTPATVDPTVQGEPQLPVTGSSIGEVAGLGVVAAIVGVLTVLSTKRRHRAR